MRQYLKSVLWLGWAVLGLVLASLPVLASSNYPSRPIRIIVPWPAGGPTDLVVRAIGNELQANLGQPVVIDNRPGATGAVGSEAVRVAQADGYTIGVANSASHGLLKVTNKNLPYDPLRDFKPIVEYASYPLALLASTKIPAKNIKEFIDYTKAQKDGVLIGLPGSGTLSHFYAVLLQMRSGAKFVYVPYRGDGPARLDLVAGNIDGIMGTPDFELIQSGKLRLVGSTGEQRWPQTVDIPTFAESGYPDLVAQLSFGFAAPAGTPDAVIQRLNKETNRALQSEEVKRVMVQNGYFPAGGSAADFRSKLEKQISQFEEIQKSGAIKLD